METSSLDASSITGDLPFKLMVKADGSDTFNPRNVEVTLSLSGQATAQTASGQTIDVTTFTAGTDATVDTFANETDPNATQSATTPCLTTRPLGNSPVVSPGTQADASWELTAEVIGYTMYGQYEECVESTEALKETKTSPRGTTS